MTTRVPNTACAEPVGARTAFADISLLEEGQRFWQAEMQRWKWRRTARRLLSLDPRIVRDIGYEPQALRYALEQGWTEEQVRHYSRADV